jgi:hypothetical protein
MALRVGITQINVTDLAVAWSFYVETLGIPGRWSLGPGKPFELDLGPGPQVLVYRVTRISPRTYPDDTGVTLVFYTDDILRTVTDWRAAGVEFIPIDWATDPSGIAPTPFGPFIAFRDPFANVHELLQPVAGP